jgi:hypothetical protein
MRKNVRGKRMSIQIPRGWEFIETWVNMFYTCSIIILFAFAWNFESYKHRRLLKRLGIALISLKDLEK